TPELVPQRDSLTQAHEQHHALVVLPTLPHGKALDDFGDLLDLTVQLGSPDAHTARVQRGIRAARNDESVMDRGLNPIAVVPHARETIEVCRTVLPVVGVTPESDWHRRE